MPPFVVQCSFNNPHLHFEAWLNTGDQLGWIQFRGYLEVITIMKEVSTLNVTVNRRFSEMAKQWSSPRNTSMSEQQLRMHCAPDVTD